MSDRQYRPGQDVNPTVVQDGELYYSRPSEFKKGLRTGVASLRDAMGGAAQLTGEVSGYDPLRKFGVEQREAAAVDMQQNAPRVRSVRDINGFNDAADWALSTTGQLIPSAVMMATGAGLGASATRSATGATLGAALPSAATETGSIYSEMKDRGLEGGEREAALYGSIAGASDVIPVARALKGLASTTAPIRKKILPTLAKTTGGEAIQEGFQEEMALRAIGDVDPSFDLYSQENLNRRIDAAAAGALGGALLGGTANLVDIARTPLISADETKQFLRSLREKHPVSDAIDIEGMDDLDLYQEFVDQLGGAKTEADLINLKATLGAIPDSSPYKPLALTGYNNLFTVGNPELEVDLETGGVTDTGVAFNRLPSMDFLDPEAVEVDDRFNTGITLDSVDDEGYDSEDGLAFNDTNSTIGPTNTEVITSPRLNSRGYDLMGFKGTSLIAREVDTLNRTDGANEYAEVTLLDKIKADNAGAAPAQLRTLILEEANRVREDWVKRGGDYKKRAAILRQKAMDAGPAPVDQASDFLSNIAVISKKPRDALGSGKSLRDFDQLTVSRLTNRGGELAPVRQDVFVNESSVKNYGSGRSRILPLKFRMKGTGEEVTRYVDIPNLVQSRMAETKSDPGISDKARVSQVYSEAIADLTSLTDAELITPLKIDDFRNVMTIAGKQYRAGELTGTTDKSKQGQRQHMLALRKELGYQQSLVEKLPEGRARQSAAARVSKLQGQLDREGKRQKEISKVFEQIRQAKGDKPLLKALNARLNALGYKGKASPQKSSPYEYRESEDQMQDEGADADMSKLRPMEPRMNPTEGTGRVLDNWTEDTDRIELRNSTDDPVSARIKDEVDPEDKVDVLPVVEPTDAEKAENLKKASKAREFLEGRFSDVGPTKPRHNKTAEIQADRDRLTAKVRSRMDRLTAEGRAYRESLSKRPKNYGKQPPVKRITDYQQDDILPKSGLDGRPAMEWVTKHGVVYQSHAIRALKSDEISAITAKNTYREAQVRKLAKQLGLSGRIHLMTPKEGVQHLVRHGEEKRLHQLEAGKLHGYSVLLNNKTVGVFVHPDLQGDAYRDIMAHELGHAVAKVLLADVEPSVARSVLAEYTRWKGDVSGADLETLLKSKKTPAALQIMSVDRFKGQNVESLSPEVKEYLYDFEEWFADKTAAWLHNQDTATHTNDRFFKKVAQAMVKVARSLGLTSKGATYAYLDSLSGNRPPIFNNAHGFMRLRPSIGDFLDDASKEVAEKHFRENVEKLRKVHHRLRNLNPKGAYRDLWVSYIHSTRGDALELTTDLTDVFYNLLNPDERSIIERASNAPHVRNRLRELLKHDQKLLKIMDDSPSRRAAMVYQFYVRGMVDLGPQGTRIMDGVREAMDKLVGAVAEHEQAEQIFQAIKNGIVERRSLNLSESDTTLYTSNEGKFAERFKNAWDANSMVGKFRHLFYFADYQMRRTKNPHLIWIADQFYARSGDTVTSEPYIPAKNEMIARYDNIVRRIYDGLTKEQGSAVLSELRNPGTSNDPIVLEVAKKTRKQFFQKLHAYMTEAGLNPGYRGETYFPWVFNADAVTSRRWELKKFFELERFSKGWDELAEEMSKRLPEDAEPYTSEDAIEYTLAELMKQDGVADLIPMNPDRPGHNPSNRFMNTRKLAFLQDLGTAEDYRYIQEFMEQDLGMMLRLYMEKVVKRTEFARRFGPRGDVLRRHLELAEAAADERYSTVKDKARREKLVKDEVDLAEDFIRAMMGTLGERTNNKLIKFMPRTMQPKADEVINPTLRDSMGWMMVVQNYATLGLATLSSLIDPIGILVRSGGDLRVLMKGFKNGVRSAYRNAKGDKDTLHDLGEMLGTIDTRMTNEALGAQFGGIYMTGKARQVNEWLFKFNGLQEWTKITRLMGLAGAEHFIKKHATKPSKHSKRYLEELNITPDDVVLNDDGSIKVLSVRELSQADTIERARDQRIRTALNRFVDESILRPDAAQRPIWASDPHFMLIWHLKSYMYSFHARIIRRFGVELNNYNIAPLAYPVFMYLAVQLAADAARDEWRYGDEGNPYKANWGWGDYLAHGISRTGMTGAFEMGFNVSDDWDRGGAGFESFLGPSFQAFKNLVLHGDPKGFIPLRNVVPQ